MHRSFAASVDSVEYWVGWLNQWVGEHLDRAGTLTTAALEGTEPEEPLSTRQLNLWIEALGDRAGDAFNAHEEREAREQGASLALAGAEGWDATGQTDAPAGDDQ